MSGERALARFLTSYAKAERPQRSKLLFARVLTARRNRYYPDAFVVIVACPGCGAKHEHGIGPEHLRRLRMREWLELLGENPNSPALGPNERPWTAGARVAHCVAGDARPYLLTLDEVLARRLRREVTA